MKKFIDIARERYTTKKYDQLGKVPDSKIQELKETLRLSPSSINSQPWRFTFITQPALKASLAKASYFNESRVNEASHLVVFSVIDDIALFEKQVMENLHQGAIDYYNRFIRHLSETEIKAWMQHQVYLSLGFFLSACAAMEIDSTPMEGIEPDKYDALIGREGYKTLFAVALGYRATDDANQPTVKPKFRLPMERVVQSI